MSEHVRHHRSNASTGDAKSSRASMFAVVWYPKLLLILTALLLLSGAAQAQVKLNFRNIVLSWPYVRLDFSVKCKGTWSNSFEKQHFKVWEDSVQVGEFELLCPNSQQRCHIAVAIILDASGSMAGDKNYATRQAANVFVDNMDGVDDHAAVLWFDSRDTLVQGLTTDKVLLRKAIDSLPSGGTTAVWDATYSGIKELVNNGSGFDTCGAVIVLTDGNDNASMRTLGELVSYAVSKHTRVYTVGLGEDANEAALSHLAGATQGKYFRVLDLTKLGDIYQDIFMDVAGIENCSITYLSNCPDGSARRVDLELLNFCGGSDSRWLRFTAPNFPFNPTMVDIGIADTAVKENEGLILPVQMLTPLEPMSFPLSTVTVAFDTSIMAFSGLGPLGGCLLQNAGLTAVQQGNTVLVRSSVRVPVQGAGTLFRLRFTGRALDKTMCGPVTPVWEFTGGCLKAFAKSGEVCVTTKEPNMRCSIEIPSDIRWDKATKDYVPNPIRVAGMWINSGEKTAKGARVTITYDPKRALLLSPTGDTQSPALGSIAPGDTLRTEWLIRLLPRGERDTVEFCLRATFDNAPSLKCCARIQIDAAGPALRCSIAMPALRADSLRLRYDPSPLDLFVTVTNAGGTAIDSIVVALALAPELRMADGLEASRKALAPALLLPGESGTASWRLRVPLRNIAALGDITVTAMSRLDTSRCSQSVVIPGVHAPMLDAECAVPAVLQPDTAQLHYLPDPFDVSLRVHNDGDRDATGLSATLLLPDGVELTNAAEPLTKTFSPSTLAAHTTGNAAPGLQWRVRMARRSTSEVFLPFRWLVQARGPGGWPLDTIFSVCTSTAGAFPADLVCSLDMPTRSTASADSTRIEPDVFPLRGVYRNIGSHSLLLRRVLASVSTDGMRFDAATPPLVSAERVLQPGDSLVCVWRVHLEPRTYSRVGECRIIGIDDQQNQVVCNGSIRIDGIPAELVCDLSLSHDTVRIDAASGQRIPESWSVRATVTNYGKRVLTDVTARLRRDMQLPFDPDPSSGDTATAKSSSLVFPGQSRAFVWPFRLRGGDTSDAWRDARFLLDIQSRETVPVEGACDAILRIAPSRVPKPELVCAVDAPDTIRASDTAYVPSAFAVGLHVRNVGSGLARNCRAYLLMNAHFSALSSTQRVLGDITAGTDVDIADAFMLRALPLPAGGLDTVRISILSDNLPPMQCAAVVGIEAARSPALRIDCIALPDRIVFDTTLRRFVPDTVAFRATVTNMGSAMAHDVVVSFGGSSAFVPLDSSTSISAGNLQPGASVLVTERLRALASGRDVDTLGVGVHGRGGFGNTVVSASCASLVTRIGAPASRYELACNAPDTVRPAAGAKDAALSVSVRVTNTGSQTGDAGMVTLSLPAGVRLDVAETLDRSTPPLQEGGSTVATWRLAATPGLSMRALRICVLFRSARGDSAECCTTTILGPAAEEALLALECDAPDSLHLAAGLTSYKDAPFAACARVRNTGPRPVSGIVVRMRMLSSQLTQLDTSPILIAGVLQPGELSAPVCRLVTAKPESRDTSVMLEFSIDGSATAGRSCVRTVFLAGTRQAVLAVSGVSSPPDTLHFDRARRDFEGIPSTRGAYRVFVLTATVRNDGAATARQVRVRLLPPDGIAFEEGETAEKAPAVDSLAPGSSASVSWLLTAQRRRDGIVRRFVVRASAGNAPDGEAPVSLFVQGGPMLALVRMPDSLTASSGDILTVPVDIDPSYFGPIASYRLLVTFDPRVLRFRDAHSRGTLTETGWDGPKYGVVATDLSVGIATLQLQDSTSRLPIHDAGTLAFLRFDVHPLPAHAMLTDLTFPSQRSLPDGSVLRDALNGKESTADGDIAFTYENGMAGLADGCVSPLSGGPGFTLSQNAPNPFNPSTEIRCTLAKAGPMRLLVFDVYGRLVRVLAEGNAEAGEHRYRFDASGLAGGVYVCRMEAAGASASIRMVLLK